MEHRLEQTEQSAARQRVQRRRRGGVRTVSRAFRGGSVPSETLALALVVGRRRTERVVHTERAREVGKRSPRARRFSRGEARRVRKRPDRERARDGARGRAPAVRGARAVLDRFRLFGVGPERRGGARNRRRSPMSAFFLRGSASVRLRRRDDHRVRQRIETRRGRGRETDAERSAFVSDIRLRRERSGDGGGVEEGARRERRRRTRRARRQRDQVLVEQSAPRLHERAVQRVEHEPLLRQRGQRRERSFSRARSDFGDGGVTLASDSGFLLAAPVQSLEVPEPAGHDPLLLSLRRVFFSAAFFSPDARADAHRVHGVRRRAFARDVRLRDARGENDEARRDFVIDR